MFRRLSPILLLSTMLGLTLLSSRLEPQADAADPAVLQAVRAVAPLRGYEKFPFTDAEYQQVSRGETAFKGREVPGSALLEGAVAKVLAAPAWKVWRAVVDEEHHNQYMPQLKFSTVLQGKATGRLIYDFLEIPLLSDRQWVVEAKHWGDLWRQSNGKLWLASFKTPPSQQPSIDAGLKSGRIPASIKALQGDTVTLKESRASYTLIELDANRCLVEYRAFSDPGGKIPTSILNYGAPSTMKSLVANIEKRAQSADKHFQTAGHPVIYDPLDRPMAPATAPRP